MVRPDLAPRVARADYAVTRLAAAVLVAGIVVMGLTNIPWASLAGENLGYKRMGITAGFEFVGGGLMVVAAVTGSGLVGLAVATVAVTLMSGVLYLWLAHAIHPLVRGGADRTCSAVRRFLGLSWWFLLWNFVTRVTMGGDIVVLGIAGSAAQVTSYSLTRFIPLTITAAVASVIFGMAPGLGGLIGAGEMVRAARVRSETMAVAWLLATVAGAGVLLLEESFLRLWVGQRYYPGPVPTLLIVVMVLQLTLIRVDSNIIDLTLNIRRKVLVGAVVVGALHRLRVVPGLAARSRHRGRRHRLHRGTRRAERHVSAHDRSDPVDRDLGTDWRRCFGRGSSRRCSSVGPPLWARSSPSGHGSVWSSRRPLSGSVLLAVAVFGGLSERQRRWLLSRARRVIRLR